MKSALAKILAPGEPEEFLASAWGKSYKHVKGWPGKFAHLLPWAGLNEVLRRQRLDFPRLRLIRDGKSLPVSSYIRHATNARRKTSVPRLRPVEFSAQLRAGATLVLDAVDELFPALEELAEGLELIFRERIQINAYAGWRSSRGFDLHWDDHDVFILQVTGRKRWQVYGMTRPYPVAGDSISKGKPQGEPLWTGTLEDGDLLYLPRGFWHVALPLNEPTLHLTVGVRARTGLDLLRWAAERLRESEAFRRELPRFALAQERAAHAEQLRQELLAAWDEGLLESYLQETDALAEPRARVSLPWSALPAANTHIETGSLVRWTPPRPVELRVADGVVEFSAIKKRWRFAPAALSALRPLAERRQCLVSELCEEARGQLDERTVRALVRELLLHGLVAIVED